MSEDKQAIQFKGRHGIISMATYVAELEDGKGRGPLAVYEAVLRDDSNRSS